MIESKNRYLNSLQIFRGIAALMVVVHHAVGSLKYYHNINNSFLEGIGTFGKFGVDFFFILSGFIISYSVYYKYNDPGSFKNYLKNRIIRIYIPYLPIGIFMYLLYSYFPGFSNGSREISLLTSLTLFPDGNPALSVAWTLTFELFFYLVFSISFYSKKVWNYFIVFWTILILTFNYTSLATLSINSNPVFNVVKSTYNIEFILGYLLSLLIIYQIKINTKNITFVLLFLSTIIIGIKFTSNNHTIFYMNYLFSGIAFIILYLVINNYKQKINNTSILMSIGNASYSIYLIHNPLQMLILRLYPKINSISNTILALVIVLFLSSLFGYVYYLIFEKKCMNYIKSKIIK